MKVYIGIKYHEYYNNKPIVNNITSALERKGYETVCIIRDIEKEGKIKYSASELMKITFQEIDSCDLIFIDLTEKGVGLGIEAGYAFSKGIPIVIIAKYGSEVSETLVGISENVIFYDDIEDIDNQIEKIQISNIKI